MLVLHALTGDTHVSGPAGPGHPTPGWWDGLIGPGGRSTPTAGSSSRPTCSAAVRARTGPVVRRPGRPAVGLPLPVADHPRPGRGRRPGWPTALGIGCWAWCVGGSMGGMRVAGVGGRRTPTGSRRRSCWPRTPLRHGRPDRLVRTAAGGDPVRPRLPRRRLLRRRDRPGGRARRSPAASPTSPTAASSSWPSASAATPQAERGAARRRRPVRGRVLPGPPRGQAGRPLRRQLLRGADRGDELPRRRPRPRRRRTPRLRRITGNLVVAAVDSDRLYPPRLSDEIVAAVPSRRARST